MGRGSRGRVGRSRDARLGVIGLDDGFSDIYALLGPENAAVLLVSIENNAETLRLGEIDHDAADFVGYLGKGILAGFLLVIAKIFAFALEFFGFLVDVLQLGLTLSIADGGAAGLKLFFFRFNLGIDRAGTR
jgi:hypothetical protein